MTEYKEKLKVENIILSICIAVLAGFSALGFAAEAGIVTLTPTAGDSHWQSMWRGFMSGAAIGLLALMVFGLIQNIRALRDEKQLKKHYIKNHDERTIQIWTSARAAAYQACLLLGLAAVVVAGYFSTTVSITILVCVLLGSLSGLIFKIYYSKKY